MTKPLSAEKYIQSRARTLIIDRCLVNADWETSRMAHVIIIRKHTNGNFTYAGYLVDLLCLGVKDTYYEFNIFQDHLEDWLDTHSEETEMLEVEYSLAHNIIFAGHDLAAEYHIPQHPDFVSTTRYLLEEDDEKIPLIEIHTGDENRLPHLIVSSNNKQPVALARLKEYAGEGRYLYTILEDDPLMEDDDDFVDEEEFGEDDRDEEDGTDCIFWSKEEWKSFINSLSKDNYPGFDVEISYINMCAVTRPEFKKRGLDFRKMIENAGKGVDWDEAAEDQTWLYGNEEKEELGNLYDQLFDNNRSRKSIKKTIEGLRKGISQWPHNPVFRNYLYNAYLLLGDKKTAEAEMHETIKLFPEYLVAKTIYAEWLLKHDRPEEVPGLFNSKWYLSDLYSARKHFHINEFIHFNSAWLLYYLHTEDLCMADFYGSLLESIPDGALRELQHKLLQLLQIKRTMHVLTLIGIARSNPAEMDKLTSLLVSSSELYTKQL
jgi:tetratricopeptide (TPR) repeat protein